MKKSINLLRKLGILFCFILFFCCIGATAVQAYAAENLQYEEKELWNGTIDDNFSDNSLIVVVDKYHSGINKVHSDEFFGTFEKNI